MKKILILISFSILMLSFRAVAQAPTNGLVSFYPFSGNANDMSGHGYDGIVESATLTSDRYGNPNSAYHFYGSDINLTNYLPIFNNLQNVSISFWIKTSVDTPQVVFTITSYGGNDYSNIVIGNYYTSTLTNELITQNYDATGSTNGHYIAGFTTSNRSLLINSGWHHIVAVYDNIHTYFYLDTISLNLSCNSGTNNGHFGNIPNVLCFLLGGPGSSNPYSYCLNGSLDDIRIYNRTLTTVEIKQLFTDTSTSLLFSYPAYCVTATPSAICLGAPITLNASGGGPGTGNYWSWYSGSCGGTYVGSGTPVICNPSATTIYYVRSEGNVNSSSCVSIEVTVYSNPLPPSPVTANPSYVCGSGPSSLNAVATGCNIKWWNSPSGGQIVGYSNSGNNFQVWEYGVPGTTYYAEAYTITGGQQSFTYNGTYYHFTVPSGVTKLRVDASGAQGGA